ncbi:Calcineurin-like phosphoesterase [Maridesulfovibrio ferrireducens]|uniref:Calcineurin-like phosphoesterase n=1 Tax=Maridesulfovibrio ferrireducens TaxID=246191 RepID=A0A1G9BYF9_9BACT|nr:metallophosphoesterase [Maridesulfovibrio ferrireducens]SDK44447.1 Calcineurin-like phosphoesterase [Maridesulfovibrio ferrireducens]
MSLEVIKAEGLLLIGDPHIAATPPGQRLSSYTADILDKLEACLKHAKDLNMVPLLLGDLFHWPRDNSNSLLVDLIALFGPYKPFVLIGNHDKYQARFTPDVSMAVLDASNVIRMMNEPGPAFVLETPEGKVLVGASPDGFPIPKEFGREEFEQENGELLKVVWVAHHNVAFPEYKKPHYAIKEIPGIDWVINGHIHRPRPTITAGSTTWANPGNISRLAFTKLALERKPQAAIWTPQCIDLEKWDIPHRDFYEVFPNQDFLPEIEDADAAESKFLQGLERLAWKRTHEGSGLKQFLEENIDPEEPESKLIWDLYTEVTDGNR